MDMSNTAFETINVLGVSLQCFSLFSIHLSTYKANIKVISIYLHTYKTIEDIYGT